MSLTELQKEYSFMNDMQQKAVFQTEGPVLILAGAGSGKTTVLVNRISYILRMGLCRPWQILAITFTNKAATELKERICKAVPEQGDDIWAATFHSTCSRICVDMVTESVTQTILLFMILMTKKDLSKKF